MVRFIYTAVALFLLFGLQGSAFAERLQLNTTPSRAKVYLNGTFKGRTPMVVSLATGRYHLELRQSGYLTWTSYVQIPSRTELSMKVRLERGDSGETGTVAQAGGSSIATPQKGKAIGRSGLLVIRTEPTGVGVYSGRKFLGYTPLLSQLPIGRHSISLRQAGYKTVNKQILVQVNKSTRINLKMQSGAGDSKNPPTGGSTQLLILSTPIAIAYLNGRQIGKTPFLSNGMPSGRYTLKLKAKGYFPFTKQLRLFPGQNLRLKVLLIPKKKR